MLVLVFPLFLLILHGYALTLDVKHVPTAVFDEDGSRISREFLSKFKHSEYFDVKYYIKDKREIAALIDSGKAAIAIWLPRDFSKDLISKGRTEIEAVFDGVDSSRALIASSYVNIICETYSVGVVAKKLERMGKHVQFEPINYIPMYWYNPDLRFMNFLVPGLICTLLMILSALLTSVCIVGEKESGNLEGLITSPLKPLELMIGKIIPYIVIALTDTVLITAVGAMWFRIPVKGSVLLLFSLSFLFLFSALGMGLFISTIARTRQEAFILAIVGSMLPSILLSGFVFPIKSMAKPLQVLSYFVPARYFLTIIRGIFLKGIGINYLWPEALLLTLFGIVIIVLAGSRFRKKMG
ncbi:MAG: ABC transporter permease [Candidatus Saganbacteria bacterium]|nr:ABC transporter permease [Candidatus Saganbacteria bacterium]